MLLLGIVIYGIAIPLCSNTVNAFHYTRLSVIIFMMSALLTIDMINIGVEDMSIYCNLVFQSDRTIFMDVLLFIVGGLCITMFNSWSSGYPKEYSLVLIFSVIGASIILSSYNIISIYLSTELQSFSMYIIAAISRDSLRSVQASLKYFILGAWSSAFILLGTGIIYTSTGSTSLVNMSNWISSTSTDEWFYTSIGIIFLYSGYIFKVSAAPFHNWAPDVYQNTPTVVTIMLITIPKVSIMTAIFTVTNIIIDTKVMFVLLVVAISSIVIGTVTGLVQIQLRRLIAFSTISHVGYIVLCISLGTESSSNALIFYIVQYSLSTILIWICIQAYEYGEIERRMSVIWRVDYISDMRQSYSIYSIITFSIVIGIFSISGLPPLVGFIAKMNVLCTSVEDGAYVIFIVAIMSSVVSATYYLKIIKMIMFDEGSRSINSINTNNNIISPIHAFSISACTAFISFYILDSELIINIIELSTI